MEYGLFGLIILALDIWALLGVWSSGASTAMKLLWTAIILVLPVVGLILWFFVGPRRNAQSI